VTIFHRIIN